MIRSFIILTHARRHRQCQPGFDADAKHNTAENGLHARLEHIYINSA
jgi:hypothetical protein